LAPWKYIAVRAACVFVLLPSVSRAQDLPQEASGRLEEIVVTGSRIARPVDEATGPVTVVNSTDLKRTPADSIGKVLQALPLQTGATHNTQVNNGADGATRLNLRGLGDERTLVLLNGRRVVFGGLGADSSVDLNMIPLSMIERVEISAGGASAIYGADAVAGVVNILTRRDFTGLEVGSDYSLSAAGDGGIATAHALAGRGSDRGNITIGAEYVDQAGVGMGRRDYSRYVEALATPNGPVVHVGSMNVPQGFYGVPARNALGLDPGPYTTVNGTSGRGPNDFRPFDFSQDLFNYAPYNFLQTPSQRGAFWLQARRELTSSVELFAEGLAHHSKSRQQIAPSTYASRESGAAPLNPTTGRQVIPANNYYNPFGVNVPFVARRILEGGDRLFREVSEAERVLLGLRGNLGTWHWETSIVGARNRTESFATGEVLRTATTLAVGPSGPDATGHIVCGTPDPETGTVPSANIIEGCVPLNLFGGLGPDGRGTITPDQLSYISRNLHNRGVNEQRLADVIFTGPFGRLPAGAVGWAFGVQYRQETGKLALDPLNSLGVSGSFGNSQLPDEASFHTEEVFAETRLPLLADLPAAIALDATLGARYSRFSAFGATTTYQGGIRWSPARALTLRGGYAKVFRAPTTLNLYATQSAELDVVNDPCGSEPSPAQQINCAANGVPGGSYVEGARPVVEVTLGGNPYLVPERGDTWNAGFLVELPWLDGSRAAIDYYRVRLSNAIGTSNDLTIVTECANSGASGACGLISRAVDGSIIRIDTRSANLSRLSTDGVDFSVRMSKSLPRWGTLSSQLTATYLANFQRTSFVGGATTALAGTTDGNVSWPRWRAQAAVDWSWNGWSASYGVRYIGHLHECGDPNNEFLQPNDCRVVDDRIYHNATASHHWPSGITVALYVTNIANTPPPRINLSSNANTDPAIYDVLGRVYSVHLSYSVR
jgi:iron complex outermembrane receptor protein